MKFVGSKNKISKYIAPILQKCLDDNDAYGYFEPFLGGANMMDKIVHKNRWGSDIHEELIAMWQHLIKFGYKDAKKFQSILEKTYHDVRENSEEYPKWFIGFVGFHATFGSKYFGGYARGFKDDKITPRNISNEAIRNTLAQLPKLEGVHLECCCYTEVNSQLRDFVIYCDPPYANTTEYKHDKFDHEKFWDWVRIISEKNHVFISEYNAPKDFEVIWQMETTTTLKVEKHEKRVEKLFKKI
jgi:site-specific DNA-adenine methylase